MVGLKRKGNSGSQNYGNKSNVEQYAEARAHGSFKPSIGSRV